MKKIYLLEVDLSKERQIILLPFEIIINPFYLGSSVKEKILSIEFLIESEKERDKKQVPIIILRRDEKIASNKLGKFLGGIKGKYVFIENKK